MPKPAVSSGCGVQLNQPAMTINGKTAKKDAKGAKQKTHSILQNGKTQTGKSFRDFSRVLFL